VVVDGNRISALRLRRAVVIYQPTPRRLDPQSLDLLGLREVRARRDELRERLVDGLERCG
jgi:hypothetical protein